MTDEKDPVRAARLAGGVLAVLAASGTAFANNGSGVPEIGPDSLATALTVLTGGLLVLTGWRRKE